MIQRLRVLIQLLKSIGLKEFSCGTVLYLLQDLILFPILLLYLYLQGVVHLEITDT